jgi:hypothetical protein
MKSLETFIQEARKNPDQNPKIPVSDILEKYINQSKELQNNSGILNCFISMTKEPKLGINPVSTYNTPLGIYAYPLEYAYELAGNTHLKELPFAGNHPYFNLFRIKGKVVNLNRMDKTEFDNWISIIKQKFYKQAKLKPSEYHFTNDAVDRFVEKSMSDAKISTYGGRFWYVTLNLAEIYKGYRPFRKDKRIEINDKKIVYTKPHAIAWNKLLRDIGIDATIDQGEGIIHSSEPTQIVIFNYKSIKDKERHENRYNTVDVEYGKKLKDEFDHESANFKFDPDYIIESLFFSSHPPSKALIKLLNKKKQLPSGSKEYFIEQCEYVKPFNVQSKIENIKAVEFFFRNEFDENDIIELLHYNFAGFIRWFSLARNPNITFAFLYERYKESVTANMWKDGVKWIERLISVTIKNEYRKDRWLKNIRSTDSSMIDSNIWSEKLNP